MEIEIFGGINEIGGNKVLLTVSDKKFLFDFGLSFNESNQYFSEFLSPRRFNGIIDYLYLDLIPSINEFYRNDYIKPFQSILEKEPFKIISSDKNIIEAAFLTHAHIDHYKFLGFLKQKTPIYMNWITHTIIEYLSKTSNDSLIPEILNFYEAFKLVPKKRQIDDNNIDFKRAKKPDYKAKEIKRQIKLMDKEKPLFFNSSNGEIQITQYTVDHSIPGACAYIIENDGRSIIYTGDFRRHGFHSDWVNKFVEHAHNSNPIAIITEGTRVPSINTFNSGDYRSEDQTEGDVEFRSRDMIRRHPGLLIVNFPTRNLDRILLYYNLTRKYDRIFAVTPKTFLFIDSFRSKLDNMKEQDIKEFYSDYNFPEFNDEYFKIYLPRKGWGRYESLDYKGYQKLIFENVDYITYRDVQKEPDRYLIYLDYYMLGELIDLNLDPNTVIYINSTTDPFTEEMEIQEEKLDAWLKRFGILKTETIHSSGHCNVDDLIDALQKIDAENVIPIHTEHPETFKEFGLSGKIIFPEKKNQYTF
ncbi:MAG: MBL fold metallo-hydrolase RNA specificity domain-containing protein [Promethearchaeota archaeon]